MFMSQGYCVKCKVKTEMINEQMVPINNPKRIGAKRIAGTCKICGCKMSLMVGK
jgi:hypothetical protein